jgi:hypothetical protein
MAKNISINKMITEMKKTYIAPHTKILVIKEQYQILAGTTTSNSTMSDGTAGPTTGGTLTGGDQSSAGAKRRSYSDWEQ